MPSAQPPRTPADEAAAAAVCRAFKLEDFFPEFTAEHCAKLFPRSGVARYADGEVIIEQGESGRDLFLLLEGRAVVALAADFMSVEVARMEPGAVLGEMALLSDGNRTATIVAAGECAAYRLAFEDLGYILQNNEKLAEHLRALARVRSAR